VINDPTDYNNIVWEDGDTEIPSRTEIANEILKLQADLDSTAYQRLRAPEYPPIGDQLDALWKGGEAAAEMLIKIQAVKAQYPKPEGV
jgi:hypothetical protein